MNSFAMSQNVMIKQQIALSDQMGVLKTIVLKSAGALPVTIHTVILKKGRYQTELYLQPATVIEWVNEVVKKQKAVIGINAGYFMENFKPNGLLVIAGKRYSAMKYNRLLSALVLINQQKTVELKARQQGYDDAYSALQVGPILVVNGQPKIKSNLRYHRRTVLATAQNGDLIILQSSASNLYRLADVLTKHTSIFGVKKIVFAVNCDGGSSSALMINDKNKLLYLSEGTPVKTMLLFKGANQSV